MSGEELRSRFLTFYKEREHTLVPSSSLLSDDPSVLLTTAGMQQFKPYFTGEKDPNTDFNSLNTASIQKSFRTSDIDEVGDESHLTFFEMLGNFSFGGYFKKEAIEYAHEFITKELGLSISFITIFEGDSEVSRDRQSEEEWKHIDPTIDIRTAGIHDNFWGPTGSEGPCGPTTEIYVKNAEGQDIEIWNIVFNEFYFPGTREELLSGTSNKKMTALKTPGVDTGMGLERLAMVIQQTETIFETDLFAPLISALPQALEPRTLRIIADHVRAACFLIADGVRPSNKEAGYVLRRLMRRTMALRHLYNIELDVMSRLHHEIQKLYANFYPELTASRKSVDQEFKEEATRFNETLDNGIKTIDKLEAVSAEEAFRLYATDGLPYEVIKDLAGNKAKFTREEFEHYFLKHQEVSRAGAARKFKGGLADNSEEVVKLHTATHLMNAALRKILGEHIWQKGSNITPERTRFDFTHGEKLTPEQLQEVERLVNDWIKNNLTVKKEEMSRDEAQKLGAIGVFGEKYPETVSIYTIMDPETGGVVSREFCGGPHAEHTGELGTFKIQKEESSSAGVRRIKATLS